MSRWISDETDTINGSESASDVAAAILWGEWCFVVWGSQAMEHDDSEYWKAAILDEIHNHEEIFQFFGPPIPR